MAALAARIVWIALVATGVSLGCDGPSPARAAEPSAGGIRVQGLVDLRGVISSQIQGWEDGGLGKTRYGGDGSGRRVLAQAEAALVVEPRLSWDLTGFLQVAVAP